MNEVEAQARKEKARRQSIFDRSGRLLQPQSLTKRSICNVHLELANALSVSRLSFRQRQRLLMLIDEAYILGKRMATALDIYKSTHEEQ